MSGAEGEELGQKMIYATTKGDAEELRRLLAGKAGDEVKAAVNYVDEIDKRNGTPTNKSPLHWAAEKGHAECARVLTEAGADVNKEDGRYKETPLHWAIEKGHAECARVLIEAGADVNKEDGGEFSGKSPLQWAAENGHAECARVLIEAGADRGHISLHRFCERGDSTSVRVLLSLVPADKISQVVNVADDQGCTAAYLAATHREVKYGEWGEKQEMVANECLDVLIFEYGVLFLSKSEALLTQREKLLRLAEFFVAAVVITGSVYGYLSSDRLTQSCDTAFGGMLLQPYLFDFVTVFVFKVIQYAFEVLLLPVVDFLWFYSFFQNDDSKAPKSSLVKVTPVITDLVDSKEKENVVIDIEMARQGPTLHAAFVTSAGAFASVSLFSVTGLLYAVFSERAIKEWRKEKYLAVEKVDPEYHPVKFEPLFDNQVEVEASAHKTDSWYQVPYLFLYLQTATALISICVAAAHVDRSVPAWQQYSSFFAVVVNSGAPTQVFSIGKMAFIDGRYEQIFTFNSQSSTVRGAYSMVLPPLVSWFIAAPLIVLLVPFLSHILPAVVLYCWLVFIVLVIVPLIAALFLFISLSICGAREQLLNYHFLFYGEILGRFLLIFLFQSLFTYAALFYASDKNPDAYIDVIAQDWHLRSQSLCFIDRAATSSRGLVTLFSWF